MTKKRVVERVQSKLKIWKIKGDNIKEYNGDVVANQQTLNGKIGIEKRKTAQAVLPKVAEEVCGKTKGGRHQETKTWWRRLMQFKTRLKKPDAFKQ